MRKLIYAINLSLDGCCDHTKMVPDEDMFEYHIRLVRDADLFVLCLYPSSWEKADG